jgi:hypothetical protein
MKFSTLLSFQAHKKKILEDEEKKARGLEVAAKQGGAAYEKKTWQETQADNIRKNREEQEKKKQKEREEKEEKEAKEKEQREKTENEQKEKEEKEKANAGEVKFQTW